MSRKQEYTIRLERDTQDYILPKDFYDILVHRLLPVISMTYIATIIGIAISKGHFIHYMFQDRTAYIMALAVVIWVSVPAVIWILLHGSPLYRHVADIWYKILAAIMVLTVGVSFVLFPEADIYGMRIYMALSVPVFMIIYLFFIKGGLPAIASYPLNAIGFCALIYGATVHYIF
tara:strand:- start:199 stop:723 length:525 start_codon:yes stop_codon:yes gene_type:complete